MARRSSGLRLVVDVVKIIDRAGKQAERNKQRLIREYEREVQRSNREAARQAKIAQRDAGLAERAHSRSKSQAIKDELRIAKQCFEYRIDERRSVKEEFIKEYMR
jgi:hypothetical protein